MLDSFSYGLAMDLRAVAFSVKGRTARRSASRAYRWLLANETRPRDQLDCLTAQSSAAIAQFAASDSPFYRDLYSSRQISLDDLADPQVWHELPVVDRSMLKEHSADVVARSATPAVMREALTGGSTGEPLRSFHDTRVPTLPLSWRMYRWWGVEPWDDIARVGRWGFGRRASIVNALQWWPTRQIYADAALIDRGALEEFTEQVARVKPVLIEGYVGAMLELATFIEISGRQLPAPRAVATTAAPLTEGARTRLQDVFGAPVYDEYRGAELGWMAGECQRQEGLHCFTDMRRIEILDDHGRPQPPGVVGDVVVTDLFNRVFPLVRYRLGDRGSMIETVCPCGVTLPLMDKPDGRTTDLLRLPSGVAVGHRLMGMFGSCPDAVRLFQIFQAADYAVTVRVVRGSHPNAEAQIEAAVSALRGRLRHEVPVRTEYVDRLPYIKGKLKYVMSEVPDPSL